MQTNRKRTWVLKPVVLSLALLIVLSGSAWAVHRLLNPAEVAEQFQESALAAALAGPDALLIDQSVVSGGYQITLLGLVSGKALTELPEQYLDVEGGKTYAVLAFENTDRSPMPAISDPAYDEQPFLVTPLIRGESPWQVNIFTLNQLGSGYSAQVIDGVMYRIVECDALEIFADRGVYLAVSGTVFYDIDAFDFDQATGEISLNPAYEGVNALFQLPLDVSRADYARAQAYLDEIYAPLQDAPEPLAPDDSIPGLQDGIVIETLED